MSAPTTQAPRWLVPAGALLLAGAAGFGIAQLTHRDGAAPAPAAPAVSKPSDVVAVAPAHLATMQIAVQPVTLSAFAPGVEAPGTVVSAPNGEAVVTAQAAGAVTRLNKRIGDAVRAGETLAMVASREASLMAADRVTAEAKAALARSNLAREQRLFEQRITPRQDLERAQAELTAANAEAQRARAAAATAHLGRDGRSLVVVSPISGTVTAQPAALGAFVQPDTELFRIADPRFVQVEAAVPPADAGRVRVGDPGAVTTSAGARLEARVRSVSPTLDAQTRAATVVLTVAGGPVSPGDAVQVRISPSGSGPAGVVIPDEAVQSLNGRDVVFLRTPTGFKAVPVVVGARSGGRASITSGLSAGQSIATRNAFLLKAELTKGAEEEE